MSERQIVDALGFPDNSEVVSMSMSEDGDTEHRAKRVPTCAFCGCTSPNMTPCRLCEKTTYCSKMCLGEDYRLSHRFQCMSKKA